MVAVVMAVLDRLRAKLPPGVLPWTVLAYVLMCALRRIALAGTDLEWATCGTIRLRLLKIGAQVTVSVRRVKVALATSCPWRDLFNTAYQRLSSAAP